MTIPYLDLKLSWIGLIQFGISLYLITVAFSHLNDPTTFPDVNTHKRTKWALKHYKVTSTGIKYFNYTEPDTGEVFNGTLSGTWFDHVLLGKYVYFFGKGYDNYCWPREIPDNEWFPSLFRSSQLKPWVQVPLRAAILLGINFRIFQAIIIGSVKVAKNPNSQIHGWILRIFVANELIHNVFLFGVSNYLVTPDVKYFYLFGPAMIVSYLTFALKMLFSVWHLGVHWMTILRLCLFAIVLPTFPSNFKNTQIYLEHNYCDHYTTPLISLQELAVVMSLLASELTDILQMRKFDVVLGSTEVEQEDEEKLRNEALKCRKK